MEKIPNYLHTNKHSTNLHEVSLQQVGYNRLNECDCMLLLISVIVTVTSGHQNRISLSDNLYKIPTIPFPSHYQQEWNDPNGMLRISQLDICSKYEEIYLMSNFNKIRWPGCCRDTKVTVKGLLRTK